MPQTPEQYISREEAWELNHKVYKPVSRAGLFMQRAARAAAAVLGIESSVLGFDAFQSPTYAISCEFTQGFETIHDQIPNIVGECLVNEHYNPQNGDALQETTNGLMAWRRSDNKTVFTNGYWTWVNGPNGIQVRLNTEIFPWEQGLQEGAPFVESSLQITPWKDPRSYASWGPLKTEAEGNPAAAGQPSVYEAAALYDRYAAEMGKRADLENQVRNFADWYLETARKNNVPQSFLNTAGFCSGVAKASASGENEPSDWKKILILALLHSQDNKYMPGKEQLIKDLVEKGAPFVSDTATAEGGSWTRAILKAEPEKGIVWASNFGRQLIAISIADIKDEDVYAPVPAGRERAYPAEKIFPSALSKEYRDKIAFVMDREVVDYILSH